MTCRHGLSRLFEPFSIRETRLKSRFVMPGMTRGWGEAGKPSRRYIEYFGARSDAGAGLIITESCAVPHPSATGMAQASIITPGSASDWRPIVDRVHDGGGKILLQLWHEGAVRREGIGPFPDAPTLSPSGLIQKARPSGRAATLYELEAIRDAYVSAALTAQQVGFDGVEVHCAHGYLLDLFLWSETNLREDRCGGSTIIERLRYPAEIVSAIRNAVRSDLVISMRFSQWKEVDFNAKIIDDADDLRAFLAAFRSAGVDVFHVSTRRFWEPEWEGSDLSLAGWTKQMTDAPVIAVGSVGQAIDLMTNLTQDVTSASATGRLNLNLLAEHFDRGDFDLIAVGRALIADPDWIMKVRKGEQDKIVPFDKKMVLDDLDWDPSTIS